MKLSVFAFSRNPEPWWEVKDIMEYAGDLETARAFFNYNLLFCDPLTESKFAQGGRAQPRQ